jgi:16S rRNA (adenine1518-N6/adenine1519-N6)-dimethyltransferase
VTVHSPLASPTATIDCLTRWGLNTRKSLGQHFLIDDGVVGRILRLAALEPNDVVLEVGPGIGTLTEALLRVGVRVVAVEKDERLLPALADMATRYPGQLTPIAADALDLAGSGQLTPIAADALDLAGVGSADILPIALVANLPYAVAATIVLDCFQRMPALESATVMVQKEVAARMAAGPGSKDYGAYTVKLRLLTRPRASFAVNRASFLPPPRVDSTVIRLDRLAAQPSTAEMAACLTVIEAAFVERRKTIRNSMRSYFASHEGLEPAQVDALLAAADIPPTVRGETLTTEGFQRLARALIDASTKAGI